MADKTSNWIEELGQDFKLVNHQKGLKIVFDDPATILISSESPIDRQKLELIRNRLQEVLPGSDTSVDIKDDVPNVHPYIEINWDSLEEEWSNYKAIIKGKIASVLEQ